MARIDTWLRLFPTKCLLNDLFILNTLWCLSVLSMLSEQTLLLLLSHFSRVRLLVTPWTAAYQAPPSMGFSRQEYWSGVQLPSPGFILPKDKYIVICSWNSYSLLRSSKLKEQTNSNAVSNPLHLRNYLSVLKPNSSSHTEPTLNILFDNYKSFLWKPLLWLPESVLLKTLN